MTRDAHRTPAVADRRSILVFAAISVVTLAGGAMLRVSTVSPFAPRVYVRWADDISDAHRTTIERRFALVDGLRRDGATWEYDLTEPSPSAARALIAEPAVVDTHYIDRESGVVAADAPLGTTRLTGRRVSGWIHSSLFDWFMSFWVSSLAVSGVWLALRRRHDRIDQ